MTLFAELFIVLITFYGLFYIFNNQNKSTTENQNISTTEKKYPQKLLNPQQITANLCVIVKASVIGNLKQNDQVDKSKIEEIIDNSLYFVCTNTEDANNIWEVIEKTDEDIKTVGKNRDIYLRVNINRAEEMIGKKVRYSLKEKLPPNGQGVVRQLACLKPIYTSGLEKFNDI